MENTKYKAKRFLLPILALVLTSIITIGFISAYITINMSKTLTDDHIEQITQEYTQQHKNRVYKAVNIVNDAIKFQITTIENKLKASLKEKIIIASDVAQYTYDTYKDKLNKEEIKEKIAKALEVIKFNDNRSYYFMYDNKTKIIFGHPMEKFVGRNMKPFRDVKGQSLMDLDTAALAKNKIGYSKIYFNKPDNQNEEFPKITCITKFEPLDLVLGIGEYLDVIENRTKEYVLKRFSQSNFHEKDSYITILDVHDMQGGDAFATVLLNSNRPELVGKKVSGEDKDIKGNRFKKDFLDMVVEKGAGYSEYWYKKPSTNSPALKVSYVHLQKDWNWIILSGFYYEDLEKQIANMRETVITHKNITINKTLTWVLLISLLAIFISIFVSIRIDKTIKKYTNKIIDYEDNKRKQENTLMQQSKLVSMGEMIGNIAHQWRQPLTVISMSANNIILDIDLDNIDTKDFRKNAKDIVSQTSYLSTTINDFQNFIKPNREKKIFNLKDNVNSFIHLVSSSIKSTDINIILELKKDIRIVGYENELMQCMMNIFNNAKDTLIEHNIKEKLIFITTSVEKNKAIIQIRDNGGGIPKDVLLKIFEPYFTTKHKSQGTGLGLHMTYNLIVDGMSGTIEAYNEDYVYDGKNYAGAEFKITLPMS